MIVQYWNLTLTGTALTRTLVEDHFEEGVPLGVHLFPAGMRLEGIVTTDEVRLRTGARIVTHDDARVRLGHRRPTLR